MCIGLRNRKFFLLLLTTWYANTPLIPVVLLALCITDALLPLLCAVWRTVRCRPSLARTGCIWTTYVGHAFGFGRGASTRRGCVADAPYCRWVVGAQDPASATLLGHSSLLYILYAYLLLFVIVYGALIQRYGHLAVAWCVVHHGTPARLS